MGQTYEYDPEDQAALGLCRTNPETLAIEDRFSLGTYAATDADIGAAGLAEEWESIDGSEGCNHAWIAISSVCSGDEWMCSRCLKFAPRAEGEGVAAHRAWEGIFRRHGLYPKGRL